MDKEDTEGEQSTKSGDAVQSPASNTKVMKSGKPTTAPPRKLCRERRGNGQDLHCYSRTMASTSASIGC